ncbi:MAG: hypothetical protein AAGF27_01125 [Pseudomonadota bacterium]
MWYVRLYQRMRDWELNTLKASPSVISPSFLTMGFFVPFVVMLLISQLVAALIGFRPEFVFYLILGIPVLSGAALALVAGR